MNLIIDIGNTRTKVGVFDGEQLIKKTIWKKDWTLKEANKITARYPIRQVALSAVADYDTGVEAYFRQHYYYLKLSAQSPLPFKNGYKSPKTLGKDRLAGIAGACQLYPGKACLVIDAGTCITYDIIDQQGLYHGGNICPGINMRFQAMHHFTDKLPLVRRRKDSLWIGNSTNTALRSGGQIGAILEMDGFIRYYRSQFGRIRVLLTGGDSDYFVNHLKTKIFVHSDLVLIGLNKILNYNVDISN